MTLPRAGCPAKLNKQGRRALVRDVPKNLMVTDRAPEFLCEPSRRKTISAALHLYGRVTRRKPLLCKKAHDSLHGVAKRHLKDSQTMRNKILWSDETKIEFFGLNAKCHIWRKPGTFPTVKHGGDSIMLWG
uniref:Transposase n=1 Tax=Oncorhynchus tshawytscha TaxID=74940 RepID=A0AAZ3PDN8_ONCTS